MAKFKLDEENLARAIKLKKGGANHKDIAHAIGVAPTTFSEWINHPKTKLQRELAEQLKKAEADYKNALQAIILRDAKERDWKAAAWLLERKYPEEYSRVDRVTANVHQKQEAEVRCVHVFDYGDGE